MLLENRNSYYLNKLFNDYLSPIDKNLNLMKTNIIENEDSYLFEIAVPGLKKENIDIKLEDKYITVTATFEKNDDKEYLLKEFDNISHSRSYYVGNIEFENIGAKLENGILLLTVFKPKEKEINNKKIVIE